jgi:ABC-type glycerol-3-phosphate transport system permease component
MTSIPDSLIEAARIDGGSDFYIFLKIIVPIVKPALATLGIIFFMNSWNAFVWPLIILQDIELQTIPVVLTNLQGVIYTPYNLIMAGSVISIIPLFVVFMFMQQYFISGITAGAVKQ